MRIYENNQNDHNKQLNSLTGLVSVLGFAIGIIVAPTLLNKIIKLGSESFSYDYYKIVDSLIEKK